MRPKEFKKFYVYAHIDPTSKEIVYIGKGSGSRAWECNYSLRKNKLHYQWLKELIDSGYTPADFVVIWKSNLSHSKACALEYDEIQLHRPKYNVMGLVDLVKLTSEQRTLIKLLRERNVAYEQIAKQIGSSAMTVWRFHNKDNK